MADTEKPARDEEFYYLLTEGSELLQVGKVEDARRQFERALEMHPTHEQALNLLGLALFRLNHLDRARQIFADLVHNSPVEPSLRLNLAMVHLKTGHLDAAAAELEHVLELNPDHPRATSYMGLVLERKGDLDRAAAFYERAGNKKRADEIRAYRPTATGTFPLPNLSSLMAAAAKADTASSPAAPAAAPATAAPPAAAPPPSPTAAEPPQAAPPQAAQPQAAPPQAAPPQAAPPQVQGPAATNLGFSTIPPTAPKPITGVVSLTAIPHTDPRPAPSGARASQPIEAAALTAAAATALKKGAEPPPAAPQGRDGSLGYTFEIEDKKSAATEPKDAPRPTADEAPAVAAPKAEAKPKVDERPAAPAERGAGPTLQEERLSGLAGSALSAEEPTLRDDGLLAFPIPDVGYVRTDLLVALCGQFEIEPVNRRYRGKRTDSLFGGVEGAIAALLGKGLALLHPDKLNPRLLSLKNEELYLVESALLAFTQGLVWENGRLPSEADRDLDIVHLRGSGRLVLGSRAPLVVLAVKPDSPAVVHAARLIGWSGQLVPYRAPLPGLPENARRVPVVRFEGTGTVLAV